MIKLTEKLLTKGLSTNNGFSKKQIRMLGEDMSRKGWRNRLLKKIVSETDYDKFLNVRNEHLDKNKKKDNHINTLEGYINFKSEDAIKKCILEEIRYGRESNISKLLFKLIKREKYLIDQNEILNSKNENCYCQNEIEDENYTQFLNKS